MAAGGSPWAAFGKPKGFQRTIVRSPKLGCIYMWDRAGIGSVFLLSSGLSRSGLLVQMAPDVRCLSVAQSE